MAERILVQIAFVLLVLGCAEPGPAPAQGAGDTRQLRCRTELQVTPGPLGTVQSTPVQTCEPVAAPTPLPGNLPPPGGTPAPTTQTVPAPKSDTPPPGN
jgi:hypothetical protein